MTAIPAAASPDAQAFAHTAVTIMMYQSDAAVIGSSESRVKLCLGQIPDGSPSLDLDQTAEDARSFSFISDFCCAAVCWRPIVQPSKDVEFVAEGNAGSSPVPDAVCFENLRPVLSAVSGMSALLSGEKPRSSSRAVGPLPLAGARGGRRIGPTASTEAGAGVG